MLELKRRGWLKIVIYLLNNLLFKSYRCGFKFYLTKKNIGDEIYNFRMIGKLLLKGVAAAVFLVLLHAAQIKLIQEYRGGINKTYIEKEFSKHRTGQEATKTTRAYS